MNTYHDGNGVHTLLVVGDDGHTLMNLDVDPNTHELMTSDGTTGSDNGPVVSRHDGNNVAILMGVSSSDGKTPIALYATSGALLVEST